MIGVGRRHQAGAADRHESGDRENCDSGTEDRMPRPRPWQHDYGGDRNGLGPGSGKVERPDRFGHAGV